MIDNQGYRSQIESRTERYGMVRLKDIEKHIEGFGNEVIVECQVLRSKAEVATRWTSSQKTGLLMQNAPKMETETYLSEDHRYDGRTMW